MYGYDEPLRDDAHLDQLADEIRAVARTSVDVVYAMEQIPAPPYAQTATPEGLEYLQDMVVTCEREGAKGQEVFENMLRMRGRYDSLPPDDRSYVESSFHDLADAVDTLDRQIEKTRRVLDDVRMIYAAYVSLADQTARDLAVLDPNQWRGRSAPLLRARLPAWSLRARQVADARSAVEARCLAVMVGDRRPALFVPKS